MFFKNWLRSLIKVILTLEVEALYVGQPDAQLPKILAATVSGQPPDILMVCSANYGQAKSVRVRCYL